MRSWIKVAPLVLLLALASCRTAPLYNVQDASFNAQQELTIEQATTAIMNAGSQLGWSMTETSPGLIQATLNLRDHQAVVNITYDTSTYSIGYVESQNLKYEDGEIHKNYNSWVQNLERQIRQEANAV